MTHHVPGFVRKVWKLHRATPGECVDKGSVRFESVGSFHSCVTKAEDGNLLVFKRLVPSMWGDFGDVIGIASCGIGLIISSLSA